MKKCLFALLVFAAVFYLFVFPALVANGLIEPTRPSVIFGLFLYLQLWLITVEIAYSSASALYGFKRINILPQRLLLPRGEFPRISASPTIACMVSFSFVVYAYAIAYSMISLLFDGAFNCPKLDIFSGLYFSLITIATIGYGDIYPVSKLARLTVMSEVVIGLCYVIFFFSILAGAINRNQNK